MKHDAVREQIRRSLDEALAPLEPTAAQKARMAEKIAGGQEMKHKTRLSLGLVLAIVLTLLAVGAAAAALLSAQEVIEKNAVPLAMENDTAQRKTESYTHDQLVSLIRTANENGITLDESTGIMLALKKGEGYWEDEAIMEICREAFGGVFYEWTYDQQYWFLNLMGELNGYESDLPYPGPEDLTVEQARSAADRQLLAAYPGEAGEITAVYRRQETFTTEEDGQGVWVFTYQPNDLEHTKFMVSVSRDGTAEIDAYPQDWAHFAVNQLEGAVNDAFRAVTGTKSSWDQAAWHAFSEKLPYADRENGWTREHDAYLQSVYPLPDARDISWKEALAAVLADAGRTDTENGNHVLLEIDGRHVWKITLPDLADAGWRSGGTSWQIDARTGEILERAVWDLGDSAWRAYVPDSVYAAVRQGMLTGREAAALAADAVRKELNEPDIPFEDSACFETRADYREWKQQWSITFVPKSLAWARAEARVNEDRTVSVTRCTPSLVTGDTLYQRYQEVYSVNRWRQDTWVRFGQAMRQLSPEGWEGKLLKQTVYPEESSVPMTREQAVDIAFAHNELQGEEELDATLIGAAPHPVWKVVLSGDSSLWLYEIDVETGNVVDKEAFKPDNWEFDNPLKRYTLHRDFAPAYAAEFGMEQLARIEVTKYAADMTLDEPQMPFGPNGEAVHYRVECGDHTVLFQSDVPGTDSYRITFTEGFMTEKIETLPSVPQ